MKITKKEFINAICAKATVFVYAQGKTMPRIPHDLRVHDNAIWRSVVRKASNFLEFNSGSRLYFDSFAKNEYARICTDMYDVYCMTIHEIGLPYDKYLFYIAPRTSRKGNLYEYRLEALSAAEDLEYPSDILERISMANTESEICRAMTTARHMHPKE